MSHRKIDNIDKIAVMSDEELENKIRWSRSNVTRAYTRNDRDIDAEIDYCYYWREAEIRQNRAKFWSDLQEKNVNKDQE